MKVCNNTEGGPPVLHIERLPSILDLVMSLAAELQIPGILVHTKVLNTPYLSIPKYFNDDVFLEEKYNEDFIEIIVDTDDDRLTSFIQRLKAVR